MSDQVTGADLVPKRHWTRTRVTSAEGADFLLNKVTAPGMSKRGLRDKLHALPLPVHSLQ
jgi:hypothetical protein